MWTVHGTGVAICWGRSKGFVLGGFGFAPMVRPTAAPEEGEDARAEYAGLDDQHAMHKAAFLGDVVEARRIAGEHPRVAPDAGSMDRSDATAQP